VETNNRNSIRDIIPARQQRLVRPERPIAGRPAVVLSPDGPVARMMQPMMAPFVNNASPVVHNERLPAVNFTQSAVALSTPSLQNPFLGNGVVDQQLQVATRSIRLMWMRYGLPVAAALLIVLGIWLIYVCIQQNQAIQHQIKTYTKTAISSGESVNGKSVATGQDMNGVSTTGTGAYATSPQSPKIVDIPSLDISARVTEVGLDKLGDIGTPSNITDVAWYTGSSSPATVVGNALIVGHVGTTRLPGVFANLYKLKSGNQIKVVMGDNVVHTYAVTASVSVPEAKLNMSTYLGYSGVTDRRLTLITCTGDFNASALSYNQRLVVSAEEVK
jgi:LPXTG-site transpeptidase (sortase) family protein